jgi:hypothetical protein
MPVKEMSTGKLEKMLSTWRQKKNICPAKEPFYIGGKIHKYYCGVREASHPNFECMHRGEVIGKQAKYKMFECDYVAPPRIEV